MGHALASFIITWIVLRVRMLESASLGLGCSEDLKITGVIDGPLRRGLPKAVELYAVKDIPNIAIYGIGSANNGDGSVGVEYTFPAGPVQAGEFLYVSTARAAFNSFLGFSPTYAHIQATNVNGDDTIELFKNGAIIDSFGFSDIDGTGTIWEYMDGWAYRKTGSCPQPNFNPDNWTYSGINALDSASTNDAATNPWPVKSFSTGTWYTAITKGHFHS